MRRTALLVLLALIGGLGLGTAVGLSLSSSPVQQVVLTASAAPAEGSNRYELQAAVPTQEPLDCSDNGPLLERTAQVLAALKEQDYGALSLLVHPQRGLTLTPYSTVDLQLDNRLSREQVARLAEDETIYTWGLSPGSGAPIQCTAAAYFERYVFNADYTEAPRMGVDTVLISGNALENVADAYADARFVEYHFPGIDPELEGFDWCSLKLVFEVWDNDWYLVGLIHGEWTV